MGEEKVSVVLPTYNRAKTVEKAIESVLAQTYPHFELLVVDDGSTDGTEEIVRHILDDRIRYFKLEENGGQAKARNYGIEKAQYDYIAFQDSDDIWYREKLEAQMQRLTGASPQVGFVYHKIMRDFGDFCAVIPPENVEVSQKSGDIFKRLLSEGNLVPCPAVLARRECVEKAGGFDTGMCSLEDYDLALKMARAYQAAFIDQVLLDSVLSGNSVSLQSENYLISCCYLLQKYKADYLRLDVLQHRMELILREAEMVGMQEQILKLMELSLR